MRREWSFGVDPNWGSLRDIKFTNRWKHDWADLMQATAEGKWVTLLRICQKCGQVLNNRIVIVHPDDITPAFNKKVKDELLVVNAHPQAQRRKVLLMDEQEVSGCPGASK